MSARGIAEQMTHRLVFRRRLPSDFGRLPLYVSTESGLRYLVRPSDRIDPVLLDVARRYVKVGMSVWDVGANVGLFAFAAASRAGPTGAVLAFEPDVWLCGLLRRSGKRAGPRAAVEVISAAASSDDGLVSFNIAVRSRSTNFIEGFGTTQTGGIRESLLVPTVALDTVLDHRPPPDFLKIDVEGAEVPVLLGASKVLAHRPIVFCEVAGETSAQVTETFTNLGYRIHDAALPDMPEVGMAPPDTLAIPR